MPMEPTFVSCDEWRTLPGTQAWDRERRSLYLLKEESYPISADALVCPRTASDADGAERVRLLLFSSPTDCEPPENEGILVEEGWTLMGFDVCDAGLISGLMNCGYTPQESSLWRPRWAHKLNDWHLFGSIRDACAFALDSDTRVPEHAPFRPVGVLLQSHSSVLKRQL